MSISLAKLSFDRKEVGRTKIPALTFFGKMEREERLRAAKEKLKKFQKKKQEGHSTTPSDLVTENESCRSTPGDHDVHTNLESGVDAFETRQSHTSSSVSDQIEQVLSASSARRLSDLTSDDIELSKIRIGQLEREKLELATANHQFRSSIQALENNLSEAVSLDRSKYSNIYSM